MSESESLIVDLNGQLVGLFRRLDVVIERLEELANKVEAANEPQQRERRVLIHHVNVLLLLVQYGTLHGHVAQIGVFLLQFLDVLEFVHQIVSHEREHFAQLVEKPFIFVNIGQFLTKKKLILYASKFNQDLIHHVFLTIFLNS